MRDKVSSDEVESRSGSRFLNAVLADPFVILHPSCILTFSKRALQHGRLGRLRDDYTGTIRSETCYSTKSSGTGRTTRAEEQTKSTLGRRRCSRKHEEGY